MRKTKTMKLHTPKDKQALERMLNRVRANQQRHFERTGKLLTPYDSQFWALTEEIDKCVS